MLNTSEHIHNVWKGEIWYVYYFFLKPPWRVSGSKSEDVDNFQIGDTITDVNIPRQYVITQLSTALAEK